MAIVVIVDVVRLQRISFIMGHMLMYRTKRVLPLHCIVLHLGKLTHILYIHPNVNHFFNPRKVTTHLSKYGSVTDL